MFFLLFWCFRVRLLRCNMDRSLPKYTQMKLVWDTKAMWSKCYIFRWSMWQWCSGVCMSCVSVSGSRTKANPRFVSVKWLGRSAHMKSHQFLKLYRTNLEFSFCKKKTVAGGICSLGNAIALLVLPAACFEIVLLWRIRHIPPFLSLRKLAPKHTEFDWSGYVN